MNNAIELDPDLNLKQNEFVRLYTSIDPAYYGNATKCYIKAYGIECVPNTPAYLSAKAMASKLVNKPAIIEAISKGIDSSGFNDSDADKELVFMMKQHGDLRTKLGAVKEYNAVKGRTNKAASSLLTGSGNVSITMLFNQAEEKKREIIEG